MNNPINRIDPTGNWSWKKFWHSFAGAFVGVALAIVLGPAGLGMSLAMAGMWGGIAGGTLTGGLEGGWQGMLIGAAAGGALGGLGGWGIQNFGPGFGVGMLAAGAGVAGATDNWDSFAGGFAGGLCGAAVGNGIVTANKEQFSNFRGGNGFRSNADVRAAAIKEAQEYIKSGQLQEAIDRYGPDVYNQAQGKLILASDEMNQGKALGGAINQLNKWAQVKKDINFIKDFFAIEPKIAETMKVGTGDYFVFRTDRFTGHILSAQRVGMSMPEYGYIQNLPAMIETRGPYFIGGSNINSQSYLSPYYGL